MIVYKSLYGLVPQYLRYLFTRNSTGEARTQRNASTDLKVAKNPPRMDKDFFRNVGVKLWNSLSTEAKGALTLGIFKILAC